MFRFLTALLPGGCRRTVVRPVAVGAQWYARSFPSAAILSGSVFVFAHASARTDGESKASRRTNSLRWKRSQTAPDRSRPLQTARNRIQTILNRPRSMQITPARSKDAPDVLDRPCPLPSEFDLAQPRPPPSTPARPVHSRAPSSPTGFIDESSASTISSDHHHHWDHRFAGGRPVRVPSVGPAASTRVPGILSAAP